jgi:hypothetical protein
MLETGLHKFVRTAAIVVALSSYLVGRAAAFDVPVTQPSPIKIAVFPFELEDFSAASQAGSAPSETTALAQSTEEAKQQLLQSGRYVLVDAAGADIGAAKEQGLRNCGDCETAIAMKLGADQALLGVVTKISMTEYTVRFQISDARKGELITNLTSDLRIGADYSWSRGVRWLMQNRMLASK